MLRKLCALISCLPFVYSSGRLPVSASLQEKNPNANSFPLYVELRNIGLSGEFTGVEGLILKRDTATITLKQGQVFFLSPVAGKVTGAVFIGEGEIQMTPTTTVEQRHLKLLTGEPSITERFTKMVLRFTDSTYEDLKKEAKLQTGTVNSAAKDALDDQKRQLRRGRVYATGLDYLRYNIDARLLMDLTSGRRGLFHAYFNGKRFGDMLFVIDPLGAPEVSPEEVALVCVDEGSLGIWVAQHLKDHYTDGSALTEEHRVIDVEHYKIEANPKGKRLDAVVQMRFKAEVDGERVLPFNLFPRLRVTKVRDGQGVDLPFIQENKDEDADFSVILQEGLKKGQQYSLTFEYGGDDAVEDSGGGNYTLVARTNWYPAAAFEDWATYEMTLKCPKGLTMVATGQPLGKADEGDYTITRWKSDVPLAVAGFNYGKFKSSTVQDEKTKYTIETHANREIPDYLKEVQRDIERAEAAGARVESTLGSLNTVSLIEKGRAEAQVSIQLFSDTFGPLPYGRIAMTQQPFFNFGQAWPMLVYMPLVAYLDSTHRHQLGWGSATSFVKYVASHEVAHQWWGNLVGWRSYRDQWLSEGFAQFSASLFAQLVYKNDKFLEFWREQREAITAKNQLGKRPIDVGSVYMGYRLDSAKTGSIARSIIYPKGAFILHMLRMLMWDRNTRDERFSTMMKDFVKTYYNRKASTEDFWAIVEKHMTKEMDLDGNGKMNWFFTQWVYGTYLPDYKLEYRLEPGSGGQVRLLLKVTQSNVDDSFKMRVPVYLEFDSGVTRLGSVACFGNSTTQEFEVALPKKPKRVVLCYYDDVLCTTNR